MPLSLENMYNVNKYVSKVAHQLKVCSAKSDELSFTTGIRMMEEGNWDHIYFSATCIVLQMCTHIYTYAIKMYKYIKKFQGDKFKEIV